MILLTPKSRAFLVYSQICRTKFFSGGSVSLASSDPFAHPVIDLGYLTHPFDLEAIREGARLLQRFFSGPAWTGYVLAPITPDPETPAFDEFVRGRINTVFHPVGTTAMSKRGTKAGVLDPDLKVKGVEGLRVVDAGSIVSTSWNAFRGSRRCSDVKSDSRSFQPDILKLQCIS